MEDNRFEALKLENQLSFPLYACSREIIKRYKPFLDRIDMTYTQYISMLVLWEHRSMTARELGEKLLLDSGTLTPLLKKLESKGMITRRRSDKDERNLIVTLTEKGEAMKDEALNVPEQMSRKFPLEPEELITLYNLLYKVIKKV